MSSKQAASAGVDRASAQQCSRARDPESGRVLRPQALAANPGDGASLDAVLAAVVARAVREQAAALNRPEFVSQRSVLDVVGMPAETFLELARDGAFSSSKVKRLVLAKTSDVVAYVEAHAVQHHAEHRDLKPANDAESTSLARVGARRVAP